MPNLPWTCAAFVFVTLAGGMAAAEKGESPIDFFTDIQPILETNCLDCHGPEEAEAEFRVDSRAALLNGGGSGIPTVVPGDTFESYLVEVLREEDEEYRMPQKADPLPEEQIALIEAWIEAGAEIPEDYGEDVAFGQTDLWSMQPVERPDVPRFPGPPPPSMHFYWANFRSRNWASTPAPPRMTCLSGPRYYSPGSIPRRNTSRPSIMIIARIRMPRLRRC